MTRLFAAMTEPFGRGALLAVLAAVVLACGTSPAGSTIAALDLVWCDAHLGAVAFQASSRGLYGPDEPTVTFVDAQGVSSTLALSEALGGLSFIAEYETGAITQPEALAVALQIRAEWQRVDREGFERSCMEAAGHGPTAPAASSRLQPLRSTPGSPRPRRLRMAVRTRR